MEGSSCSASNTNGRLVIFRNKSFWCGKKDGVRISESKENPGIANIFVGGSPILLLKGRLPTTAEAARNFTSIARD
ncbi:hypothetical protein Dsin_009523 [Dipteronia sinensis]|uniref:Uncharacterized protein n=1 Tax=Dipteronia sinensis TaxID=43782 RepID=A0AAE0AR38_9ROSI|nr:hypothetical protein Dsin_009523 [Dipteronia sinensis]